MPSPVRLDASDFDDALGVVAEAAAADGSRPFEPRVIERLARLIGADRVGYFEAADDGAFTHSIALPMLELDWQDNAVQAVLPTYPLNGIDHSDRAKVLRMSDLMNLASKRRNPWYATIMQPCRVEHELKVWLPTRSGLACGFWFTRDSGTRDFDDRSMRLMTVMRPHLAGVFDRWHQRQRQPAGTTARESEILELVRDGLSNREIADRLAISSHTVRTHLENIFEKLGVHTRTAAVRRAYAPATGTSNFGE